MNNEMKVFENVEFGKIKVIELNYDIWFVAKDISEILEYSETSKMLRRLDDDEMLKIEPPFKGYPINVMARKITLINEKGLIKSITNSHNCSDYLKVGLIEWLCSLNLINNNAIILYSKKEKNFEYLLKDVLTPLNYKILKQKQVFDSMYRIDYYINELKIAIEYDEQHHSYRKIQDLTRQQKIEKELGCTFVRCNYKHTDAYNIGMVVKEIISKSIQNLIKETEGDVI